MQRRSLLKSLVLSAVALPAWASGWTPDSLGAVATVSVDDETLLGEIVGTIIPETTTPSAKSLKVHQFALRMIRDCYNQEAQAILNKGLALTETTAQQLFGKAFADGDVTQRKNVLLNMTASTDPVGKAFVDMIKRLTIQGYTNSEYYLVNVQKFNMAPGYYHGCVPIETLTAAGSR